MESRVSHFKSKIIRVLGNLLAGKCEVRIDECLNKFLEVLEQQESKEIESAFVVLEICAQWLEKAVRMWSATELTPATGVISFTMNLASLLSKNEGKFLRLHSNNFFIELLVLLKAGQIGGVASSVKLAYVKMLSSFLEHKSGIHWIVVCSFWENIFQFSLTTQDGDVTKESTLFMSKLLEKTIDYDEHFCDDVVKRIMLPLDANFYRTIKASTDLEDADDEVATQRLMPTLKLIGDILHYFLDGILFDKKDYRVAFIFLNNFHLEERISDLMVIAQSKCLVFDVTRIVFMMQFLGLYFQVVTKNVYATSFNASLSRIRKNFIATLSVENFDHFDSSSKFGHFYWKLIHTKIPNFHTEMNESLLYSTQCLVFMLLPQFSVTLKYSKSLGQIRKELSHDVFREDFIHKLMTIIMRDAVRILFNLREYLLAHPNLFQIAKRVAPFANESRRYYTTEQAVIVFQIQLYCLKDLTSAVRESPEKMEIFLNEMDYVQQVLENVTVLISEFDISWKDSFESIDVMAFAVDFLSVPDWSPQIVVQTLKLINVATAQCMTPNLALLVDSTADSATTFLGPLLYAKLLDDGVEVKEAALEVICTMGRMSKSSKC
jgi:hypothetical protein